MTDILTPEQALIALAEGKKLTADGCDYILELDSRNGFLYSIKSRNNSLVAGCHVHGIFDFIQERKGWRVYEEPKTEKLATSLAETLRAKRVRIEWPEYVANIASIIYLSKKGQWTTSEICIIHAALNVDGAKVIIEEE